MLRFMRASLGVGKRRPLGRRPRKSQVRLEPQELESRTLLAAAPWAALPAVGIQPFAGSATSVVYAPAQIRNAYGVNHIAPVNGTTLDGTGQTIAIVDAYDDPNIATDLTTFDARYGIPDTNFTKATPGGSTPAYSASWSGEISLDVQWAHVIAPRASILLVEAASTSLADLLSAVDYASSAPGVSVVSMSWGGGEFANEASLESHFAAPASRGVSFVASTGDSGAWFGTEWPATSPSVLAVGGTSLTLNSAGNYGSETGWNRSGGGYSQVMAEPAYQTSVQTSGARTVPDVAYDANPYTGVSIYLTPPGATTGTWQAAGGTSAGAPQWAGLVALANQGRALNGQPALPGATAAVYNLPTTAFHDVTTGNNGYRALTGYDLVTGRGTPFAASVVSGLIGASVSASKATAPAGNGTTTSSTPAGTVQRNVVGQDPTITVPIASSLTQPPAVLPLLVPRIDAPIAINPAPATAAPITTTTPLISVFRLGAEGDAGPLDAGPDDVGIAIPGGAMNAEVDVFAGDAD